MGRTCGEPDEIGLTPMGVKLNGSRRVQQAQPPRHDARQLLDDKLVPDPVPPVGVRLKTRLARACADQARAGPSVA